MRIAVFNVSINMLILFSLASSYHEERSHLDNYTPFLRKFKTIVFKVLQTKAETEGTKRNLRRTRRLQDVPADIKFPCDLNITLRSKEVPTSVNRIRPGDIDVIAAMGDSLTAGNGGAATHPFGIIHEARGVVFSIGGQDTWKTVLTLPNILKNFNPNIYGFSLNALSIDRKSKFNVAEGGAISENMPYMAKILVKRIKNDKNVNVEKDWKMVTIFIGHNDFCSVNCYLKDISKVLENHKQDMLEVLTILKSNLPRTIVNIVPPIHLQVLTQLTNKPFVCEYSHLVACPCLMGSQHVRMRNTLLELMTKWDELDIEIANYPEFHTKDFTVIQHMFTTNYSLPRLQDGSVDYGYVAPDCFHASQRGHAKLANDLWNSLLEPYNFKTSSISTRPEFQKFVCPSEENPYITTKENSKHIIGVRNG